MKVLFKAFSMLFLVVLLAGCDGQNSGALTFLRPNDVVVAFGDSLTSGVGDTPELSYPAHLHRFIGRKVVNAGLPGETSAEGLKRLPGVIEKYKPSLVIICHGGNDILQHLDKEALKQNIGQMCKIARNRGAGVVLIAVPELGLGLKDLPLYKELGEELNVPVLSGTLAELLPDNRYSSPDDPVHLNGHGYKKLADAVAGLLADNGVL
jgi:lysophospholipase L1-like esterase